jgi:hypothetical protein
MSKREVFDCDKCCERNLKESVRVAATVDRICDPAGSMENVMHYFDLCTSCASYEISFLLRDHELAADVSKRIVSCRKANMAKR